jgi:hypothetical protein
MVMIMYNLKLLSFGMLIKMLANSFITDGMTLPSWVAKFLIASVSGVPYTRLCL